MRSEDALAMRKDKSNFDRVRQIGFTFPGVVESTAYGSPAIKLKGRLLACMASHRSREPGSLVVCVSFEDRRALIEEAPRIYYVTEHYLTQLRVRSGSTVAYRFGCAARPSSYGLQICQRQGEEEPLAIKNTRTATLEILNRLPFG